MRDLTPEQSRRWQAWQSANELADDHYVRIMHAVWSGIIATSVLVLALILANLT